MDGRTPRTGRLPCSHGREPVVGEAKKSPEPRQGRLRFKRPSGAAWTRGALPLPRACARGYSATVPDGTGKDMPERRAVEGQAGLPRHAAAYNNGERGGRGRWGLYAPYGAPAM